MPEKLKAKLETARIFRNKQKTTTTCKSTSLSVTFIKNLSRKYFEGTSRNVEFALEGDTSVGAGGGWPPTRRCATPDAPRGRIGPAEILDFFSWSYRAT